MNKQEFIDKLRSALSGRIPPGQVMENVNYYEDYINSQIRMGRPEREVLESLGDPRLIAKTILAATGSSQESTVYEDMGRYHGGTGYQEEGYRGSAYRREEGPYDKGMYGKEKSGRMPKWFWIVFSILIMMLVLGVILSVLSFLLPIVLPILVVLFLVKLFRDWLN